MNIEWKQNIFTWRKSVSLEGKFESSVFADYSPPCNSHHFMAFLPIFLSNGTSLTVSQFANSWRIRESNIASIFNTNLLRCCLISAHWHSEISPKLVGYLRCWPTKVVFQHAEAIEQWVKFQKIWTGQLANSLCFPVDWIFTNFLGAVYDNSQYRFHSSLQKRRINEFFSSSNLACTHCKVISQFWTFVHLKNVLHLIGWLN